MKLDELRQLAAQARNDLAQEAWSIMSQLLTTLQAQSMAIRFTVQYGTPEQVATELDNLDSAIAATNRLTNDLRDATQLEVGTVTFTPSSVDLPDVIHHIVEERANILKELGVVVDIEKPENTLLAWCDPYRIGRAVAWLLDNGVRHSRDARPGVQPAIHIRLWQQDMVVWCEVSDNGPGMTPPKVSALLERLHRISQGQPVLEGSAFGMNYVARIIYHSAGSIDVASSHRGTTITFCLPAASVAPPLAAS